MSLRFSLLSSRNFAIIINASRLFVSPCHHKFLAFQLGSHDTHQHYLFIATSSDGSVTCSYLSTNFRSSCVWPAAAEPRHDRFSVEDPEQEVEWLFRRNVPPRQRWCYRVHISKIIGEFMLGSFRFRISDCIPWLSLGQRH